VGRTGSEDLDKTAVHLLCKCLRDITFNSVELFRYAGEEEFPPLGKVSLVRLVLTLEVGFIRSRPVHPLLDIFFKSRPEVLVGELFKQHRRQADRELRIAVKTLTFIDESQQRQVTLGRSFI
jgi:hypothetical protein